MAKPGPTSETKTEPKRSTFRRLDVARLGNDDYEVAELTISGNGKEWATTERKTLCKHVSRNVAASWVEGWYREWVGVNHYADSGL